MVFWYLNLICVKNPFLVKKGVTNFCCVLPWKKCRQKMTLKSFTGQVDFDMKNWYLIFPFSGPDAWHNHFPVAIEGKRQSPIDIETSNIIDGSSVTSSKPLTWSYQKDHCLNIENTGSSWKVNVNGTGSCKLHFINWYLLTANRGL